MASRAWRELLSPPPGVEKVVLDRAQALDLLRHIERLEARIAQQDTRSTRQEREIQDLRGAHQQLREKLKAMEEARTSEEKRKDPPPSFVKPNVKRAGTPKKRGAKKGHEAHHRPPLPDDIETVEATLRERWCACGKELGEPFDWDDRTIEEVVRGHVRRRHCKIARYRCACGKLTRARVPAHWAPRKSRFNWGVHFLAAAWHAMGFPVSRIQMLFETDYQLKVSTGEIDKLLTRAVRFFAPAVEAIEKAIREGKVVVVDNTSWRVDGVNHFLWDFIAPEIKAALFVVDRSGGHEVPERELPGNPEQTVVCDGGRCFNPLNKPGRRLKRIQRDWVHIRRHAKDGVKGYETVSDAPDWRWLTSMKRAADAVLRTAKIRLGKPRDREAVKVRERVERLLKQDVEGEPARKLRKYLLERDEELWTWIGTGCRAESNPAEQGIRFNIAVKRKVSGGSQTLEGGKRTAKLISLHATARMRSTNVWDVGHRLLRGDPDPLPLGAGPEGPQGPKPA